MGQPSINKHEPLGSMRGIPVGDSAGSVLNPIVDFMGKCQATGKKTCLRKMRTPIDLNVSDFRIFQGCQADGDFIPPGLS